jgi:hypothetical protein
MEKAMHYKNDPHPRPLSQWERGDKNLFTCGGFVGGGEVGGDFLGYFAGGRPFRAALERGDLHVLLMKSYTQPNRLNFCVFYRALPTPFYPF